MPTIEQNIALIRRRLNNPEPNAPSDVQLLEILIGEMQHHHSGLVNTRNHWDVGNFQVTVSAGTEDYLVTAVDFGRPFLVYTVPQAGSNGTLFYRREVPIRLMSDVDQLYQGPQQATTAAGHSAVEVVFYRQGQSWYMRFAPIPNAAATYEIWYEINTYNYASPADTTGLVAFHNLVRTNVCLSALPMCVWGDLSPRVAAMMKPWQLQYNVLRDSLAFDQARFQKEFDLYRANSSREQVNDRIGYGGLDYEDDWYGYGGFGTMTSGYGV